MLRKKGNKKLLSKLPLFLPFSSLLDASYLRSHSLLMLLLLRSVIIGTTATTTTAAMMMMMRGRRTKTQRKEGR